MKEFKGTPAPWTLPHFADDSCSCDCGFVLVEGHCGSVANVHYSKDNSIENGDSPLPEQAKANAKLIAAAPELLEALQNCQQLLTYLIEAIPTGKVRETAINCNIIALSAINKTLGD